MNITPEIAAALAQLRTSGSMGTEDIKALNILDNAGIFSEIDESTGYDVESVPEVPNGLDPAEWGDLAFNPVSL